MANNNGNRYSQLIEDIFLQKYKDGDARVNFQRADLEKTAKKLGIKLPKNLGDVIYSFKFRAALPDSIIKRASENIDIHSSRSFVYGCACGTMEKMTS